ncbi:transcription factor bHLH47-like [Phalaenopsis equestris]|uniref:transcription factor bHLH47-like n=1 Tax=Phalaenopsis equestris TaxID=78828 RepID=UPI0009E29AD7|nr:transcription factor bHLH47-like [Phalaenopsis equestris]
MVSESPNFMSSVAAKPVNGSVPGKKIRVKVPKKIHKAEREKLKRDHLNEVFSELSHALDPARQNNGKATILCDAAKLLRDLITQVESLKKENLALQNESHYVTVEKNELEDDNAALQGDINRLQNKIQESMRHEPPSPLSEPNCSALPQQQSSSVAPVFVVPLSQDLQQALADVTGPSSSPKPSSQISRPHARYPTPDSWSLEFLSRSLQASGAASNGWLGVDKS